MYSEELVIKVCLDGHCKMYCYLVDSDIVDTSDEFNRPYGLYYKLGFRYHGFITNLDGEIKF